MKITCPRCGKGLKIKDDFVGKTARCLNCQFDCPISQNVPLDRAPDKPFTFAKSPSSAGIDGLPKQHAQGSKMPEDAQDTKTCPHCGEEIKAVAKVCRYCGMDLLKGISTRATIELSEQEEFRGQKATEQAPERKPIDSSLAGGSATKWASMGIGFRVAGIATVIVAVIATVMATLAALNEAEASRVERVHMGDTGAAGNEMFDLRNKGREERFARIDAMILKYEELQRANDGTEASRNRMLDLANKITEQLGEKVLKTDEQGK